MALKRFLASSRETGRLRSSLQEERSTNFSSSSRMKLLPWLPPRDPAAAVYIDGGHSRWLSADVLASRLNQIGVSRARGFSLNTTNYFTTEEEIGYGEAVSALTNGAHYVIDTSRNGAGPLPDAPLSWCNPRGRALGAAPTTDTAGAHADAYLWLKRVGESDGSCDRGDPQAGAFINQFAIELVRNASG